MTQVKDELYLCRYCGAVNYKLQTEHTGFISSWRDLDDEVKDIQNVPVMFWQPPFKEDQ